MSESYKILRNTDFAFREEVVSEGTPPADSATGAEVKLRTDAIAWSLNREFVELAYMTSTLSKDVPLAGMYGDLGFVAPVYLRGSGTQNTAPDYAALMKVVMGGQFDGTNDVIQAAPAPTTTGFTVAAGTNFTVGGIARIEVTAGNFEYARITGIATHALTVWPPLSAAPTATLACQSGNTHLLKSAPTDRVSGAGYFYFDGSTRLIFAGCRGSCTMNFTVGQPATCDFNMTAISYPTTDYTAIGYTPAYDTQTPPLCLGITFDMIFPGEVAAGSTVTVVNVSPLSTVSSAPALEVAIGDTLIMDVGSSSYETKTITNVTGSGTDPVACTTAAFSAVSVGEDCYIKRSVCIPSLEIEIAMDVVKNMCMTESFGVSSMQNIARTVNVNMSDKKFRSFYDLLARDAVMYTDIWIILGDVAGNIIALNIPKFYRGEVGIEPGDELMVMPVSGRAALNSAGDDELFMTHL